MCIFMLVLLSKDAEDVRLVFVLSALEIFILLCCCKAHYIFRQNRSLGVVVEFITAFILII
jgi:hypothetical protein